MKKSNKLILFFGALITLMFLVAVTLNAGCPSWLQLQTTGQCIISGIQFENEETYGYTKVEYEFEDGRWLIQVQMEVPEYSVLLGSNFNKFRLVPVSAFYQFDMPSIYILGELVCDSNGSMSPILNMSIPAQSGYIANIYFDVINLEDAIYTPCSY